MASSSSSVSLLPLGPTRLPFVAPSKYFITTTSNNNVIVTRRSFFSTSASKKDSNYGHHYNGKLVDESMIVLRMRIREIEMEKKQREKEEKRSGGGWRIVEWERRYWEENYGSDICEAVGLLQTLLIETRPCLALGILVLAFLSVSLSMSLSVFHLVELGKQFFMSINF
ncbi:uncharacterized protein LOC129322595 [Prosopis cineraria]|uniref:uncharacterized protein LOC129322595 n=1 Tax=Prosopis cineraria TaxID=364024 RepID=UPI00240ECD2D|nr:uncharacterized protein LOC129322595 [Prosopis cineraria]